MAVAGVSERLRIPGRVIRLRGGLSLRVQSRPVVVAALLACLTLALAVIAVGTGELAISPGAVVTALLGGGDPGTAFIVRELRLPRALCAVLVGVALGMSGAIFQSLTRNPLGSPDILGLQQGAAVGALDRDHRPRALRRRSVGRRARRRRPHGARRLRALVQARRRRLPSGWF